MKKLTAQFLIILMLAASFAVPAGASSDTTQAGVMQVLSVMGIMSGDPSGDLRLGDTLTRAEFAKIVVSASPYAKSVPAAAAISPYKDVKFNFWGATYIKAAADAGYMRGYSDGSFRPDQPVRYEEAVTTVLRLLGYTTDDFGFSYPYGQLAYADGLGLNTNVSGAAGSNMTRRDVSLLIYNALNAKPRSGGYTAYAQVLGYAANDNGLDFASILNKVSAGPVVVTSSSWYSDLGLDSSSLTIYKNGSAVKASDVNFYDVLYYSKQINTVWVYTDKISGIFSSASPDKNSPTSVVVSGSSYTFETSLAAAAFGAGGSFSAGDIVTVLLGREGKIAAAYSIDSLDQNLLGIVTETGTKSFANADGSTTNSYYAKGVLISGAEFEYPFSYNVSTHKGFAVNISFSDGKTSIARVTSPNSSLGYVRASAGTIGSTAAASAINIMDIDSYGSYTKTYLQRIDGINLTADNVYGYTTNSRGEIDQLILKNVTGDTYKYGVVTSYTEASGTYVYDIKGATGSFSAMVTRSTYKLGALGFGLTDGKVSDIIGLTKISDKITDVTSGYIQTSIGAKYLLSDDVVVYSIYQGAYMYSSLSAAVNNPSSVIGAYYDKLQGNCGRIRILVTN